MLVADLINERCVETFAAAGRVVARRFHGHDPIVDAVDVGQSVLEIIVSWKVGRCFCVLKIKSRGVLEIM